MARAIANYDGKATSIDGPGLYICRFRETAVVAQLQRCSHLLLLGSTAPSDNVNGEIPWIREGETNLKADALPINARKI